MLLPLTVMSPENNGDAYSSVNIVFTFCMALRKVSPVPSLAFDPTFSVICAIIKLLLLSSRISRPAC
jgi:16S rRNA A1518/A1519 N6-dimethyltransferase RsmA/KsgA/DIM1 with predicted DNA glycosylase/AP lyase activity